MTDTPESWEQQLHDAANAIPDSLRNRLYAESWSDGTGHRAVDLDRAAEITHAEVERLTAERAALWHLLRKQTRRMRTWRRRANEAIADAVEDAGRYMQRARQLRRELDEARAEVERLRARLDNLPRPISTLTGQPCKHAHDERCIECVEEDGFRPAPICPTTEES